MCGVQRATCIVQCVCVCVRACMYVCMYVCVSVRAYVRACVHVDGCMSVCARTTVSDCCCFQGSHLGVGPFQPTGYAWSAYRSEDYGYTRMTIMNDTHMNLEQVSDNQVSYRCIIPGIFHQTCYATFPTF